MPERGTAEIHQHDRRLGSHRLPPSTNYADNSTCRRCAQVDHVGGRSKIAE